jgi:hypothetical protein
VDEEESEDRDRARPGGKYEAARKHSRGITHVRKQKVRLELKAFIASVAAVS